MKKLIAILLLVVLILGIVGCTKGGEIPTLEDIKTNFYTDAEIED